MDPQLHRAIKGSRADAGLQTKTFKFNFPIGPCPIPAIWEGQEFYVQPGEPPKPPLVFRGTTANSCSLVWEAIYPYILHLGSGGDFLEYTNRKGTIVANCPGRASPVSFLLERI